MEPLEGHQLEGFVLIIPKLYQTLRSYTELPLIPRGQGWERVADFFILSPPAFPGTLFKRFSADVSDQARTYW